MPALGFFEYQVRATDPNGDPREYQVLYKPNGMTWANDTQTLYRQPNGAQVGGHLVSVQVSDGRGGTALDTFALTVTPTNLPPEIISDPADAGPAIANRERRYEVIAFDPNGDPLTYSLDVPAVAMDPLTGVFAYTFSSADVGKAFTLNVTVEDGRGGVATQRVVIPVNQEPPPNEGLEFISQPIETATPHQEYCYVVRVGDQVYVAGDALTLGLYGESRERGMSLRETTLPYRPDEAGVYETVATWMPEAEGTFEVVRTAYDKDGAQAVQRFPITVSQPHPPEFTSTSDTNAYCGVEWVYAVGVTDQDGDDVTLALGAGAPVGMQFDPARPYLLTWMPPGDPVASVPVSIVATDAHGDQATQAFTLTVQAQGSTNLPPKVMSQPFGPAIVGQEWTYTVEARDPDGDDVTFMLDNAPNKNLGMSIVATSREDDIDKATVQWTPTAADVGPWTLKVDLEDGNGGEYSEEITLNVVLPRTNPTNAPAW